VGSDVFDEGSFSGRVIGGVGCRGDGGSDGNAVMKMRRGNRKWLRAVNRWAVGVVGFDIVLEFCSRV